MRYAIFGDIHSNLEAFEAVIKAYKKENIDQYLCVGDVVGYGPNPRECIARLKKLTQASVAGNHDWAAVNLFSLDHFSPEAKESLLWTRQALDARSKSFLESLRLIYKNDHLTLAHATLHHPQEFNYITDAYAAEETFRLLGTNICFVGHTHRSGIFSKDMTENIYRRRENKLVFDEFSKYIVDVGSIGQSRDENPQAAYCIYDTQKRTIEFKRTGYRIEAVIKKMHKAGLPKALAERLLTGK